MRMHRSRVTHTRETFMLVHTMASCCYLILGLLTGTLMLAHSNPRQLVRSVARSGAAHRSMHPWAK
jgi:hypothetical protein